MSLKEGPSKDCQGEHRYFSLEMIVEADQTIKIPLVCTACGDLVIHELPSKTKTQG